MLKKLSWLYVHGINLFCVTSDMDHKLAPLQNFRGWNSDSVAICYVNSLHKMEENMNFVISELFSQIMFDFIVWMHNERWRTNRKSCYCGFNLMNCFENLLFDFVLLEKPLDTVINNTNRCNREHNNWVCHLVLWSSWQDRDWSKVGLDDLWGVCHPFVILWWTICGLRILTLSPALACIDLVSSVFRWKGNRYAV